MYTYTQNKKNQSGLEYHRHIFLDIDHALAYIAWLLILNFSQPKENWQWYPSFFPYFNFSIILVKTFLWLSVNLGTITLVKSLKIEKWGTIFYYLKERWAIIPKLQCFEARLARFWTLQPLLCITYVTLCMIIHS